MGLSDGEGGLSPFHSVPTLSAVSNRRPGHHLQDLCHSSCPPPPISDANQTREPQRGLKKGLDVRVTQSHGGKMTNGRYMFPVISL